MIRDIKEEYGKFEGKTDSIKWGKDIYLMCESKEQFPYALKCLEFIDSMPDDFKSRLCKYLYRYYEEYKEFLEEELNINEENILDYIHIKSIIVDNECRSDILEFHIEGSCTWEIEHGLEITISDKKILYVGPFEDYAPNSSNLKYIIEHYGYYNQNTDSNMNYVDKEL